MSRRVTAATVLMATLATAGCGANTPGPTGGSLLPVTPAKLAARIVQQHSGGNDPAVSASCGPSQSAENPTQTIDPKTGAGSYDCEVMFESGEGFPTVIVHPDGSFTSDNQ